MAKLVWVPGPQPWPVPFSLCPNCGGQVNTAGRCNSFQVDANGVLRECPNNIVHLHSDPSFPLCKTISTNG